MGARTIGIATALAAMLPTLAQATEPTIGTVTESANAFVMRDGTLIPAAPSMQLRQGDRLITRANGSANVKVANSCAVSVGASAMLPLSSTSCAKPNTINFDEGRTGYAGGSSAFQGHDNGFWLAGGAFTIGLAAALYAILHNPSGHSGHLCENNPNLPFCPRSSP